MPEGDNPFKFHIDASAFQKPLSDIAEVIEQKLLREGPRSISPQFVASDLFLLTRHARYTYELLFYINSEEHQKDWRWKAPYTIASAPLVRSIIDCLYNISAILLDPADRGVWFRKSGLRSRIENIDRDAKRFFGQPVWDAWIARERERIDLAMRAGGFTPEEVKRQPRWPILSVYLREKHPEEKVCLHQQFMKMFTYATWREYSALAHGSCEALIEIGAVYTRDLLPHEDRPKIDDAHLGHIGMHLVRAATVLICIVTEVQAHFRFDGANINERIGDIWKTLSISPEASELYEGRYGQLMIDRRIMP